MGFLVLEPKLSPSFMEITICDIMNLYCLHNQRSDSLDMGRETILTGRKEIGEQRMMIALLGGIMC